MMYSIYLNADKTFMLDVDGTRVLKCQGFRRWYSENVVVYEIIRRPVSSPTVKVTISYQASFCHIWWEIGERWVDVSLGWSLSPPGVGDTSSWEGGDG